MIEETVINDEQNKLKKELVDINKLLNEIDQLKKNLKDQQDKAEEYFNRLHYLQADFDNYKKRVTKEMLELEKYANEKLIIKLLDVVDNLELAIKSCKISKNIQSLLNGVEMVLKELIETLKKEGVEIIECIGENFDPNLHEAVDKIETKDHLNNVIIENIRKGYIRNGKVIRPSMVKVAINPTDKEC